MKNRHSLAVVNRFFPNVIEINDANKVVVVKVNEKDTKASKRKDHGHCALAEACLHGELHPTGMIVSRSTAYIINKNVATRYYLPERIRKEIVSFDRGGGFETGEYRMLPPQKTRRLGHLTGGHKGQHGRSGNKIIRNITKNIRTSLKEKN